MQRGGLEEEEEAAGEVGALQGCSVKAPASAAGLMMDEEEEGKERGGRSRFELKDSLRHKDAGDVVDLGLIPATQEILFKRWIFPVPPCEVSLL